MDENGSLSHTKWDCKYPVVFIPKCRRKVLYGQLRRDLGEVFRRLAAQRECRIEEGHSMRDHVHMIPESPPKGCGSRPITPQDDVSENDRNNPTFISNFEVCENHCRSAKPV